MACGVPAVDKPSYNCPRTTPVFLQKMNDAVAQVQRDHPEMFSGLRIKDRGGFRVALVANLEKMGLCAVLDAGGEWGLKDSNNFHEQYRVEVSTHGGSVRTGPDSYRATCTPAGFPVNPQPLPQRGDCHLPSSTHLACSRLDSPQFFEIVMAAMDEVIAEHPEMVYENKINIADSVPFYNYIVEKLRAQGFCAIYDGEELAIKNDNELNEQYHLILSSGQLRVHNGDAYRATCKPSSF
jgi:hypothetical protein